MGVPSEASLHMVAILVCPACYNVLDGASQNVSIVRQPRGKGRPIIKGEPKEREGQWGKCRMNNLQLQPFSPEGTKIGRISIRNKSMNIINGMIMVITLNDSKFAR